MIVYMHVHMSITCIHRYICDRICKKRSKHAFINTKKSHFEILIIVYLENAWCLVYKILYQFIVIQGNSAGAFFDVAS